MTARIVKGNGSVSLPTVVIAGVAIVGFLGSYVTLVLAPISQRITNAEIDMRDLRAETVPRIEHMKDLEILISRMNREREDVTELRSVLGASYSLRDALTEIQERLRTLEQQNPP